MDDEAGPSDQRRQRFISLVVIWAIGVGLLLGLPHGLKSSEAQTAGPLADPVSVVATPWSADYLHPAILLSVVALIMLSGFFSGSETAFFSIHRLRLRAMREEDSSSARLVTGMLDHPSRLLSTILVGNMLVNVLIGILLGTRVERTLSHFTDWPVPVPYILAVTLTTLVLVFFGEIVPKVVAVRSSETFARSVAVPLSGADRVLAPLRNSCIWFTNLLFRITRFHSLRAAPYITDEEFKAVLSGPEAQGVFAKDDLEMIQGILSASEAQLKEILTPRPDVVAVPEDATIAEALTIYRDQEYSRMPIYEEDLDHVKGVLVAKDMLPSIRKGELDKRVKKIARPAHYVPQTMTVQQFVREAQRKRTHLAIVVDEFGGTAGIVTLEDAMEEVVGDILDEGDRHEEDYVQVDDSTFRVDGNMSLDDLSALISVSLLDEEHETLAGFIMAQIEKVPEKGDTVEHGNVVLTVEACDGHRVEWVRVHVTEEVAQESEEPGA